MSVAERTLASNDQLTIQTLYYVNGATLTMPVGPDVVTIGFTISVLVGACIRRVLNLATDFFFKSGSIRFD